MSEVDFLVGETVMPVGKDERIVFAVSDAGKPRLYVVVGDCICVDADGKPLALADLAGRTVASTSTAIGVLTLTFSDGATLRCDPTDDVEAWQVVGGKPTNLVVCRPGGEVAVFDERNSIPLDQLRERNPAAASRLDEMLENFGMPRPRGFPPSGDSKL